MMMESNQLVRTVIGACILSWSLLCATGTEGQLRYNVQNATCSTSRMYGTNETLQFRMEYTGGKRILVADGGVDDAAAANLESALRQYQPVDEIWLRSPGGVSDQGTELGRVIRRWGVPTRVPAGWGCASACTMAFLGGPIRTIEPGAKYAVHMFTLVGNESYQSKIERERTKGNVYNMLDELQRREQDGALTATEQNDYIIRMGVSRKLLSEVIYPQLQKNYVGDKGSSIYCMDAEELRRYNVVNN